MISYSHYLVASFFKKISSIVFFAIAICLTIINFLLFIMFGENIEVIEISNLSYVYLNIFIFNAIIVIHIFKNSQSDGTDIFVFSTHLTRKQILLTKFIVVFMLTFLFWILTSIISMVISFSSSRFLWNSKINFVLSIFVGGLIVNFISIALSIFFATFMSKVWIILTNCLFLFFIIISSTLISIFAGTFSSVNSFPIESKNTLMLKNDSKKINPNDIYSLDNGQKIINNNNELVSFKQYQKNTHPNVMYGNIGFQLNEFFNMFLNGEGSFIKKQVVQSTKNIYKDPDNLSLNVKNKQYVFFFDANLYSRENKELWSKWQEASQEFYNFVNYALNQNNANLIKDFFENQTKHPFVKNEKENEIIEFDNSSLEGNLVFLNTMFAAYENILSNWHKSKEVTSEDNIFQPIVRKDLEETYFKDINLNKKILDDFVNLGSHFSLTRTNLLFEKTPVAFQTMNSLFQKQPNLLNLKKAYIDDDIKNKIISGLFEESQEVKVFAKKNWIPIWILLLGWLSLSSLLVGFSYFVFYRKDIK